MKVITHYGEFTGYQVQQFNKLIGKDVIVAHQLLKNDIRQHEYWLVTDNLVHDQSPEGIKQWMRWENSNKETETGVIPYHYTMLSALKERLPEEPLSPVSFSDKVKIATLSKEYNTDIITLFHAAGDFNFRSQWQVGVKQVEEVDHHLPRIGMRCRCITDEGETYIYSSSYYYHPEKIRFSETEEKNGNTTYFTLEKINEDATRLTLDIYRKKNFVTQYLPALAGRNKIKSDFHQSMQNLEKLVATLSFRPPC